MKTSQRRSERGSALVELPIVLGLVLLPFGLLVLTLPTWVERQTAARDAAGELARAIVVGRTDVEDLDGLLREIEAGYELPAGSLRLEQRPVAVPGQSVTVRITVVLPGTRLPVLGLVGRSSWTAEHTERAPSHAVSRDR